MIATRQRALEMPDVPKHPIRPAALTSAAKRDTGEQTVPTRRAERNIDETEPAAAALLRSPVQRAPAFPTPDLRGAAERGGIPLPSATRSRLAQAETLLATYCLPDRTVALLADALARPTALDASTVRAFGIDPWDAVQLSTLLPPSTQATEPAMAAEPVTYPLVAAAVEGPGIRAAPPAIAPIEAVHVKTVSDMRRRQDGSYVYSPLEMARWHESREKTPVNETSRHVVGMAAQLAAVATLPVAAVVTTLTSAVGLTLGGPGLAAGVMSANLVLLVSAYHTLRIAGEQIYDSQQTPTPDMLHPATLLGLDGLDDMGQAKTVLRALSKAGGLAKKPHQGAYAIVDVNRAVRALHEARSKGVLSREQAEKVGRFIEYVHRAAPAYRQLALLQDKLKEAQADDRQAEASELSGSVALVEEHLTALRDNA